MGIILMWIYVGIALIWGGGKWSWRRGWQDVATWFICDVAMWIIYDVAMWIIYNVILYETFMYADINPSPILKPQGCAIFIRGVIYGVINGLWNSRINNASWWWWMKKWWWKNGAWKIMKGWWLVNGGW